MRKMRKIVMVGKDKGGREIIVLRVYGYGVLFLVE